MYSLRGRRFVAIVLACHIYYVDAVPGVGSVNGVCDFIDLAVIARFVYERGLMLMPVIIKPSLLLVHPPMNAESGHAWRHDRMTRR
jgi:hypothetical protein